MAAKIVIVGSDGYIGRHTTHVATKEGLTVVCIDLLRDMNAADPVLRRWVLDDDIKRVIFLAARSGEAACRSFPAQAMEAVSAAQEWAADCALRDIPFVYASTLTLTSAWRGLYGAIKADAERLCHAHEGWCPRLGTVIGGRPKWQRKSLPLPMMVRSAQEEGKVYGSKACRIFMPIQDVTRWLLFGKSPPRRCAMTLRRLAQLVADVIGCTQVTQIIPPSPYVDYGKDEGDPAPEWVVNAIKEVAGCVEFSA